MRFFRLIVLVLLVVLTVSAPVSAEPRAVSAVAADGSLLQNLWSFLVRLWSDAGCVLDPLGGNCQNAIPMADEGCVMDPLGRCVRNQ